MPLLRELAGLGGDGACLEEVGHGGVTLGTTLALGLSPAVPWVSAGEPPSSAMPFHDDAPAFEPGSHAPNAREP